MGTRGRPRIPGTKPHTRPPNQGKLDALIALRQAKYPGMLQKDFAPLLGITRLHMVAVETGRRRASLELAARWLKLLAPEGRLSMFGPLPIVEERIRAIKRLQELSPEAFKAA